MFKNNKNVEVGDFVIVSQKDDKIYDDIGVVVELGDMLILYYSYIEEDLKRKVKVINNVKVRNNLDKYELYKNKDYNFLGVLKIFNENKDI